MNSLDTLRAKLLTAGEPQKAQMTPSGFDVRVTPEQELSAATYINKVKPQMPGSESKIKTAADALRARLAPKPVGTDIGELPPIQMRHQDPFMAAAEVPKPEVAPKPEDLTVEQDEITKSRIDGFLKWADPKAMQNIHPDAAFRALQPIIKSAGAGALESIAGLMATVAQIANQAYGGGQPGEMDVPSAGAVQGVMGQAEKLRWSGGQPGGTGLRPFAGALAEGLGGMAIDLPVLMSYGEFGLAALGAYRGLGAGGAKGMIDGAVNGFVVGKVMHGLNQIPWRPLSVASNAALFGGMSAAEGAPSKEVIKQGIIGGVLSLIGGKSQPQKERQARILEDREARQIIKTLVPDLDLKDLDKMGGAVKVLDEAVAKIAESRAQMAAARAKAGVPTGMPEQVPEIPPLTGRKRIPELGAFLKAQERERNRIGLPEPVPEEQVINAAQMVSPNILEGTNLTDAFAGLKTERQARMRSIADEIDTKVGIGAGIRSSDAIGDWADGAEHSIYKEFDEASLDQLRYSAAWKGLLNNQKSVAIFKAGPDGPDSFYSITVAPHSELAPLRQMLNDAGLQYRTFPLTTGANGERFIKILDIGSQLGDNITTFAQKLSQGGLLYDQRITAARGFGEFVGSWGTRAEALKAYRGIISGYEASNPDSGHYRPASSWLRGINVEGPAAPSDLRAEAESLQNKVTPVGTGREATGLSDIESKMSAAMRQGAVAARPTTAPPVTTSESLRPVDMILHNTSPIGVVEKGTGEEFVRQLREKYPDEGFEVSQQDIHSTNVDDLAGLEEGLKGRLEYNKERLSKKGQDSLLVSSEEAGGEDVYQDSEIFGVNPKEAEQAAIEEAKRVEAEKSQAPVPKPITPTPEDLSAAAEVFKKPAKTKKAKPSPEDEIDWDELDRKANAKAGAIMRGDKLGIVAPGTNVDRVTLIDKLKTALIDKFYPIHDLVARLAKKGISPDILHNPSVLVRLLGGVGGRAEAKVFFKRFKIDNNGKITFSGESLEDIVKPIVDAKKLGRFNEYLVARRTMELTRQKRDIDTRMDPARAAQIVAERQDEFDSSAKRFTSYFHALLDELQDSGLMSADVVGELKQKNPDYAPLRRVLDTMEHHGVSSSIKETLDKVASPIKKLRGSELEVLPPTEAAVLMTYEITSAVERNRVAQSIIQLRDLDPELAKEIVKVKPRMRKVRNIETGEDVWTISDRQDPDVVAVSFDGHRQYWQVPRDIADSMKMIHESGLGPFIKLLAIPARTLRTGATSAPEFAFRNPIRDTLTAFMNSKKGFNPLIDFPKGFFQMIAKPEEYWRWKASGGEWSMLVTLDRAFGSDAIKKMETQEKSLKRFIKTPLGYLESLSEAGEKPTRLGVFSRSRAKGLSDMEAAIQSRESSTDFHIRGANTKSVSALYTFLNARLQTTVKLSRTALEHPARFAIKGFAAASIPSMLLYAVNRDDPDYWKRSELERDTFWFLPLYLGGRQIKIPKGEVGVLFGTGVEKVLQYLDKKAEYRPKVTQFLNDLGQQFSPVGNWGETLPTAARPIMEWVTNHSFYYGTPLVQDTQEKKAAYLQYKPQTSETMKSLGESLQRVFPAAGGASPAKLENTVRGYTGGVGRLALRGIDWLADKAGLVDTGARPSDPMNIPGLAGFMSQKATGFEGEPARVFYDVADRLERYKATLKELSKQGGIEEIELWIKNHPTETRLLGAASLWTGKRQELSELRKAQNLIVGHKDLTGKEKAEALRILNEQVSKIVDPLWKLVNLVERPPRS